MKKTLSSPLFIVVTSLLLLIILVATYSRHKETLKSESTTFSLVRQDDTLEVLLSSHSSDFFIYKGTPIGFQYELLKEFEKASGRVINLTINHDSKEAYKEILKPHYDIIAADIRKSGLVSSFLTFSYPHSYTYPVILSRKGQIYDSNIVKELHIPDDYHHFLSMDLLEELNFKIIDKEHYEGDELINQLQEKEIDFMICDYQTAITLLPFYDNLAIGSRIGPIYERCWILDKNNDELNNEINNWIIAFSKTNKYHFLLKRYFSPHSLIIKRHFSNSGNKNISPYDHIIKKYAKEYGIDWQFVVAIMYQESKFQSGLYGLGGSYGLMQMMPETMTYFGIDETSSEEEQIVAGIKYLYKIARAFDNITDKKEKYHFVAASYNAGRGHILDAQRLCEKNQQNSTQWKFVSKYLILKSKKEYYSDPVVKSGFLPGKHTVKYAEEVMARYNAYLELHP